MENQLRLLAKSTEDITRKFAEGILTAGQAEERVDLMSLSIYPRKADFPKVRKDKIFMDRDNECVLIPMQDDMIPFHISVIHRVNRYPLSVKNDSVTTYKLNFEFLNPNMKDSNVNANYHTYAGEAIS